MAPRWGTEIKRNALKMAERTVCFITWINPPPSTYSIEWSYSTCGVRREKWAPTCALNLSNGPSLVNPAPVPSWSQISGQYLHMDPPGPFPCQNRHYCTKLVWLTTYEPALPQGQLHKFLTYPCTRLVFTNPGFRLISDLGQLIYPEPSGWQCRIYLHPKP